MFEPQRTQSSTEEKLGLGFSPRRHGDHGERKTWVWGLSKETRACNAEGRRPPIRADRRGPQGKKLWLEHQKLGFSLSPLSLVRSSTWRRLMAGEDRGKGDIAPSPCPTTPQRGQGRGVKAHGPRHIAQSPGFPLWLCGETAFILGALRTTPFALVTE